MALQSAGINGGIGGSPTPVGFSTLSINVRLFYTGHPSCELRCNHQSYVARLHHSYSDFTLQCETGCKCNSANCSQSWRCALSLCGIDLSSTQIAQIQKAEGVSKSNGQACHVDESNKWISR